MFFEDIEDNIMVEIRSTDPRNTKSSYCWSWDLQERW